MGGGLVPTKLKLLYGYDNSMKLYNVFLILCPTPAPQLDYKK